MIAKWYAFLDRIGAERPWVSWCLHGAVAALTVLIVSPVLGTDFACGFAIGAYVWRESEQVMWNGWVTLDNVMDVVAPIVVAVFMWLIL